MHRKIEQSDDITRMTDKELVEYTTGLDSVTPLENELVGRLETYLTVYGDTWEGDEAWE